MGAVAIGYIAIKKGKIQNLTIDELRVGRLHIEQQTKDNTTS